MTAPLRSSGVGRRRAASPVPRGSRPSEPGRDPDGTVWPRWYASATFISVSFLLLFAMCATGRPGA